MINFFVTNRIIHRKKVIHVRSLTFSNVGSYHNLVLWKIVFGENGKEHTRKKRTRNKSRKLKRRFHKILIPGKNTRETNIENEKHRKRMENTKEKYYRRSPGSAREENHESKQRMENKNNMVYDRGKTKNQRKK